MLRSTASRSGLRARGPGEAVTATGDAISEPAPFTRCGIGVGVRIPLALVPEMLPGVGVGEGDGGACSVNALECNPVERVCVVRSGEGNALELGGETGRNASAYHSYHTLSDAVSRQMLARSSALLGR